MKYVSLDLETTSLEPSKGVILEVAAVLEDTDRIQAVSILDLPYFRALIINPEPFLTDAYCAQLHQNLWKEIVALKSIAVMKISEAKGDRTDRTGASAPKHLGSELTIWLRQNGFVSEPNGKFKITVAGKNAAGFDLPWLRHHTNLETLIDVRHRVIDPAILYWQKGDECLPDMNTCLKRAGIIDETDHTALADARRVISLIRQRLVYQEQPNLSWK